MSNQNSTRIWESDSSASPSNRPAQLPSIATLTNNLPSGDNPASPAFSNNRSSDQWATPPQSGRKLDLFSHRDTADVPEQDPRHTLPDQVVTITPPRSAHLIELLIRANSELHHIRQASRTTLKHLRGSLLLTTAWASQRSTSNTKIHHTTEAAMNFLPKILAVAV